jgi:hypothetical protein
MNHIGFLLSIILFFSFSYNIRCSMFHYHLLISNIGSHQRQEPPPSTFPLSFEGAEYAFRQQPGMHLAVVGVVFTQGPVCIHLAVQVCTPSCASRSLRDELSLSPPVPLARCDLPSRPGPRPGEGQNLTTRVCAPSCASRSRRDEYAPCRSCEAAALTGSGRRRLGAGATTFAQPRQVVSQAARPIDVPPIEQSCNCDETGAPRTANLSFTAMLCLSKPL